MKIKSVFLIKSGLNVKAQIKTNLVNIIKFINIKIQVKLVSSFTLTNISLIRLVKFVLVIIKINDEPSRPSKPSNLKEIAVS